VVKPQLEGVEPDVLAAFFACCPQLRPPLADLFALLLVNTENLDGHPAAGCAELINRGEHGLLRLGGQERQQPLGQPDGRLSHIETLVPQGFWPVITQVDGHRTAGGARLGAMLCQRLGLVLQHLR
jgi:hypothetical protein